MIHSLIKIADFFGANYMRKCHGSHVVFAFVHICNVVKTTDFECVTIDDRKEGGKDVDGNNNVD